VRAGRGREGREEKGEGRRRKRGRQRRGRGGMGRGGAGSAHKLKLAPQNYFPGAGAGHYAVQGHSRSPIWVPIESSYVTSY